MQNFASKISPYIICQNKLQLITLYSMNAPNWLSTLLHVTSTAHLTVYVILLSVSIIVADSRAPGNP